MPPQTNATLTAITGATAATGGRDDWDEALDAVEDATRPVAEPAGAGAEKWTGSVRAYYRERVVRDFTGDATNVTPTATLYVDTADLDGTVLDTDDVIVLELDGVGQRTATASAIAASRLAGIPGTVATTRIELREPVSAP